MTAVGSGSNGNNGPGPTPAAIHLLMHVPLIRPTDAELAPLAVPGYNGDIAYKKRLRLYGFAVQRVFEMAVKRQLAGVASPPLTRAVNRTKAVLSAGIEGECISPTIRGTATLVENTRWYLRFICWRSLSDM